MKSKELTVREFIKYTETKQLPANYTKEGMQKILTCYSSDFEEIGNKMQKMFSSFPKFNYLPNFNIEAIQTMQKIANIYPKELFANMKAISERMANIFPKELIISANTISGIYTTKKIEIHTDEIQSESKISQPILGREDITYFEPIPENEVETNRLAILDWRFEELKVHIDKKVKEIEEIINSKATEMQWFFIFADNKVSLNKMEKYIENFYVRLGEVNFSEEKIEYEFMNFFQAFTKYYSKLELIDKGKFDKVKKYLQKISEMVFVEVAGKKIIKIALSLLILL